MAIQIRWLNEIDRVMLWEFGDSWTVEAFQICFEETLRMAEAFDDRFDIILNLNYTMPPHNILHTLFGSMQNASPNLDSLVFVNMSVFATALMTILKRAGTPYTKDSRIYFRDRVDDALHLLYTLHQDTPSIAVDIVQ